MARLEITSLAFMLLWVPLPVCHTCRGNSSSRSPAMTSSAARTIRSARSWSSFPNSRLASAAAFLSIPNARTTSVGTKSLPMEKWISDRAVCAPQYRSAGTSIAPMLSVSTRVAPLASLIIPSYPSLVVSETSPHRPGTLSTRAATQNAMSFVTFAVSTRSSTTAPSTTPAATFLRSV